MKMKKILIVDDERYLPLALSYGFRRMGHIVDTVETAEQAASLLSNGYDMVITDQNLSTDGKNGIWLLEQTRLLLPEAYRLLMTGYNDDFDCDEYLIYLLCRKPNIPIKKICDMLEDN